MAKIQQQVSEKITKRLMYEIREGIFAGQAALPPEVEIAELFDVSRNVVRECLTRLEREGWLTRKHGVGTLINKQVVRLKNRLDQTCGLKAALEQNGKHVEVDVKSIEHTTASEEVAQKLELRVGDPVLRLTQTFLADGKPAIYCMDYIPERIVMNKDFGPEDMLSTVFDFLRDFCGTADIETFITEVRALSASQEVAEALRVEKNSALLFLGETGYDLRSKPVMYAEEFYVDRAVNHMVIRKMI